MRRLLGRTVLFERVRTCLVLNLYKRKDCQPTCACLLPRPHSPTWGATPLASGSTAFTHIMHLYY